MRLARESYSLDLVVLEGIHVLLSIVRDHHAVSFSAQRSLLFESLPVRRGIAP